VRPPRTQPCENEPYEEWPSNSLARELGSSLRLALCDLHDPKQTAQLAETTGLTPEALFERLFVADRYERYTHDLAMEAYYPELFSSTQAPNTDRGSMNLDDGSALDAADAHFAELLLSSDGQRPTMLVGRVGCGKTTFLSRFIQFKAPKSPALRDFVFLHLDFGRDEVRGAYFQTEPRVRGFEACIDFGLTEYFNEHLGGLPPLPDVFAYTYDFENVGRTIDTYFADERDRAKQEWFRETRRDVPRFNSGRIRYLKHTLGRTVVICLDNIDTWEMAEQEELVHLVLQKASWHGCGLLLVVRHNAIKGILEQVTSQYTLSVMYLTPPRIDEVVRRRLRLLMSLVRRGSVGPFEVEDVPLEPKVTFTHREELLTFLGRVTEVLSTGEGCDFVERAYNHNLRRMLDFVELYISSRNTQIWRFLRPPGGLPPHLAPLGFWDRGPIGLHSLIMVAALGHGPFFRPPRRFFCNVFGNGSAVSPWDSLIKLRVLAFVAQRNATPQSMVWHGLDSVGYEHSQICLAIESLANADLIESRQLLSDPNGILFATVAGQYYIRELVGRLAYVQYARDGALLPGTQKPIGRSLRLEERLLRTAHFIEFLDSEEQDEHRRGVRADAENYARYCGDGLSIPGLARAMLEEMGRIQVIKANIRARTVLVLERVARRCD